MADSFWTVKSGHSDGDISYNLKKNVDSSYVEFELEAFSDRRDFFDIAFYYRSDSRYSWMEDAVIVETDALYVDNNKIHGLACSKTGEKNKIVWKYSSNNLVHYSVPQIKIKILPRVVVYSQAVSKYSIDDVYGKGFVNFRQISDDNLIGVNIDGEYFGIKDDEFYVMDSWSYGGVSFPRHGIQLENGNYVIADYGNDRVIELDETLTDVLRNYSIVSPVFVDYCSFLGVLLITSESGFVREIRWPDNSFPSSSYSGSLSSSSLSSLSSDDILWESSCLLNNPSCATYKADDCGIVNICDYGNNRVVNCVKLTDEYVYFNGYDLGDGVGGVYFRYPYRVYQGEDGNIVVVEKRGRKIDWDVLESSSSSSSSTEWMSSSSSSSSESYDESRYEDNGDGTVTDIITGLMWTKNANIGGEMKYNDSVSYLSNLNSINYCGYNDWRLPANRYQSGGSLNPNQDFGELGWLNGIADGTWDDFERTVFDNIQNGYYWTSNAHQTTHYQYVKLMSNGNDAIGLWRGWHENRYLWPVRGTRT